jgi:Tfp pilus assembly protein PilO
MDKTKQLGLLTAVAILAVLAGGWFLLVSPQRAHAKDLRAQTSEQDLNNQGLQAEIASLLAQHKNLPQVQAQLAKLATQLPGNPGLPALIRQLSSAADNAGVDLISISPSNPTAVAAPAAVAAAPTTGATKSASTTVAAPASSLFSVPIVIQVNGGYFQVEQFISNLEALKRSFLTTQIDLAPGKPPVGTGPASTGGTTGTTGTTAPGAAASTAYDGRLTANINGQVFMNIKSAAPATPVAPTAAK